MSFIGNVPAEAYSPVAKDTFSGDDSTTDFTLSIPATTNSVEVLVENVQQEPTTAYTISGTTLSFTAAPVTGTNNIYVIHRGPAVQQVTPPAGVAIDASTITGTGDMNIDSGTLFVDASTNRVGIGTTSPSDSLHISSSAPIIRLTDTNSSLSAQIDYDTGVGQLSIRSDIGDTGSAPAIAFHAGANQVASMSEDGTFRFNSGYGSVATAYGCRAWVNFNGTGTVAIREDGNVSSITDNGTGDYTVNFTTAMPDANYAPQITFGQNGNSNPSYTPIVFELGQSTTSSRLQTNGATGGKANVSIVCVAVFR